MGDTDCDVVAVGAVVVAAVAFPVPSESVRFITFVKSASKPNCSSLPNAFILKPISPLALVNGSNRRELIQQLRHL